MKLTLSLALLLAAGCAAAAPAPEVLKVSENGRYLVTGEGKPFFWLGDTGWELFHRLNRDEAELYLKNRADLGYTVIQAVALAEFDGLTVPNAFGQLPLEGNDPLKPAAKDGPDNDYWDHVDWVVDRANALGLTIGFLPTWGDKWNRKWGAGPEVFTPENAEAYGEWIGKRYRSRALVWILGGDRPVENDRHRAIMERMATGLRKGDGGRHLITLHPTGGQGSIQYFPQAEWLDFHMRQNGHGAEYAGRYDKTLADYNQTPVKPVLDGEPIYEGHPINFKAKEFGHSTAAEVRRPFYWDLCAGACGHTYGHHSVWQFYDEKRKPVNDPLMPWREAILEPGARQMGIGKRLMESRLWWTFVPDQELIVPGTVRTNVPGAGPYMFTAMRAGDGSCAMVYVPAGRKFRVNAAKLSGEKLKCWWFNPRDGEASEAGEFAKSGMPEFNPPDHGEALDWVLVLDDAAKKYGTPGGAP